MRLLTAGSLVRAQLEEPETVIAELSVIAVFIILFISPLQLLRKGESGCVTVISYSSPKVNIAVYS